MPAPLTGCAAAADVTLGSVFWLCSSARARTKPSAKPSCSSVTFLGHRNCVGVGVVVMWPLLDWMMRRSSSGDASLSKPTSGEVSRSEEFLARRCGFRLPAGSARLSVRLCLSILGLL